MTETSDLSAMTFEAALAELEQIVQRLGGVMSSWRNPLRFMNAAKR